MTTAAREIEPLLAQGIRHGFPADTELAVDNRALVSALEQACTDLGVRWAPPVTDLAAVDADVRVIANGIDAPALWPGLAVHPVKGEVLRLRWRKGCMPLPRRVVRARVHGRPVVPGAARRRGRGRCHPVRARSGHRPGGPGGARPARRRRAR